MSIDINIRKKNLLDSLLSCHNVDNTTIYCDTKHGVFLHYLELTRSIGNLYTGNDEFHLQLISFCIPP